MAVKKISKNGKGYFLTYKNAGQVYKNKVAKLERHIKACPKDKQAVAALAAIKKNGYDGRSKSLRKTARVVHLGKGTMSLNTLDGRLSAMGREYQGLQAEARKADRMSQHKSKEERGADALRIASATKPKSGGKRKAKQRAKK